MNAQGTDYETDMTGVHALANALSVSSSMTFVDLSSNNLTKGVYNKNTYEYDTDMTGVKAIADALTVSSSMTSLK